ncbi:hypothetical protein PtA15_17A296 [Puccinia triticina]|uniref:Uncharacterized protein n=1 Tax=Puccinia triticina TaxID=208348 RepID=A0ABY7D7S7_9BASI|nr:uncharacterized protein PtA15_17A296 [Puccinia triticina]WAQ92814.1 hypothetical protein PtA15_17A296 [Puccinia triticina]
MDRLHNIKPQPHHIRSKQFHRPASWLLPAPQLPFISTSRDFDLEQIISSHHVARPLEVPISLQKPSTRRF